jgi:hypothetical protein
MLYQGAEGKSETKAEEVEEAEDYIMTYKGKVFCVHATKA